MKVAVLGNCQARSLAVALAHRSPGIEATAIVWSGVTGEPDAEAIRDGLAAYDLVLSQPYKGFRALRPKIVSRFATRSAFFPRFYFTGLHPDARKMKVGPGSFQFGVWHSSLAMAAFLRGVPAREAADLYNAYIYGVLGYFDEYARAEALQADAAGQHGLEIAPALAGWRGQVFFNTPAHPKLQVGLALADALVASLGLPHAAQPNSPADPLTGEFIFPVYPEIARRLGFEGELTFRNANRDPVVGLEQMLAESFAAYAGAPEIIAAQPGIDEAVERLRREGV